MSKFVNTPYTLAQPSKTDEFTSQLSVERMLRERAEKKLLEIEIWLEAKGDRWLWHGSERHPAASPEESRDGFMA